MGRLTGNPLAWLDESMQAFERATGKKVVRLVMGVDAYESVRPYLDTPFIYKGALIEVSKKVDG
jgi:dihydrofolate reductase